MKSKALQYFVLLAAGVLLWLIFYPGLLSYDSLQQYAQARAWDFNDWHPPLMAVALGLVIRLGGDIGGVTLVVCLLGLFGLRAALLELASLKIERSHRLGWLATLATLGLLLPVTPLAFYFVTFWKDSWLAVALLWLVALLCQQYRQAARGRLNLARGAGIALLAGLLPSIRHNALVILPAVSACLLLIYCRRMHIVRNVAFSLSPFLFAAFFSFFWHSVMGVKYTYVANAIKEMEMAGLCKRWPTKCSFPYSVSHLASPPWDASSPDLHLPPQTLWGRSAYEPNADLDQEHQRAWRTYPLEMLRVKLGYFRYMFYPRSLSLFQTEIDPNEFGLHLSSFLQKPRDLIIQVSKAMAAQRWLAWVFNSHSAWFFLAHIAVAAFLFKRAWLAVLLLLFALSYYYSYLLASTVTEFRLMYPATLLVQVACAALLLRLLFRWILLSQRTPVRTV
jgi:hypothetical protein